jgi:hypothetical protein
MSEYIHTSSRRKRGSAKPKDKRLNVVVTHAEAIAISNHIISVNHVPPVTTSSFIRRALAVYCDQLNRKGRDNPDWLAGEVRKTVEDTYAAF